jgi:hypothetical protein
MNNSTFPERERESGPAGNIETTHCGIEQKKQLQIEKKVAFVLNCSSERKLMFPLTDLYFDRPQNCEILLLAIVGNLTLDGSPSSSSRAYYGICRKQLCVQNIFCLADLHYPISIKRQLARNFVRPTSRTASAVQNPNNMLCQ